LKRDTKTAAELELGKTGSKPTKTEGKNQNPLPVGGFNMFQHAFNSV